MKNILITGGTGLIGRTLIPILFDKGYRVSILSRNTTEIYNVESYIWDVKNKIIDKNAIINADYIIHLAGSNIGDKKWTPRVKKDIINSRKDSTNLLFEYIKQYNPYLKAFISTSAVGYYGMQKSSKIFKETDDYGKDFLAGVCLKWEEKIEDINSLGIRTVIIRTGVVLSSKGGALKEISKPIQLGLGAAVGTGKQHIPWIHIDDICGIYLKAIEDVEMKGIYNGVSPIHLNNTGLTKAIAKTLKKTVFLPNVPSLFLKIALGERADLVLKGNKISAKKIIQSGYSFQYIEITKCLENLLT